MTDKTKNDKPSVEHAVVMDQGSSLLPMLIAGLVMITLGMAVAFVFI
jgi:hypothetical protein